MKLEPLLSRARYLALALPMFALFSTFEAGCAGRATPGYYYGTGRSASQAAECSSYAGYGYGGYGYGGASTTCEDDDYGGYGAR